MLFNLSSQWILVTLIAFACFLGGYLLGVFVMGIELHRVTDRAADAATADNPPTWWKMAIDEARERKRAAAHQRRG